MNFKFTKNIIVSIMALIGGMFCSCTNFNNASRFNVYEDVDNFTVTNKVLEFKSTFFGDFKFAKNEKEFKQLNPKAKPRFKEIVVYGKTVAKPIYDVYILKGKLTDHKGYVVKDTILGTQMLTLAISKDAPVQDIAFLQENFNTFFD